MDNSDQPIDLQAPDTVITGATLATLEATSSSENEKPPGQKSVAPTRDAFGRFFRDWRAKASLGVLVFFVLLAIIGPPIYQHIGGPYTSNIDGHVYGPQDYHNYYHEELDRQNEGPSAQYWLGTDDIGRDQLARLMQGVLISIVLAIVVEIADILLGVFIGVLAGYYGGWLDQFLARATDITFAFPQLLFLIMVAGIFGTQLDSAFDNLPIIGPAGGGRLILIFVALSLFAWPVMARIVRGQTLQLKEQQFVEAARTSGTTNWRIMFRHIVPNLLSIIIVYATLDMAGTIGAEAGLSVLGLGIQPPGSSLGLMIESGAPYTAVYPYEVLLPSFVLVLLVLAFSFMGDALQDAFDPH